MNRIKFKKEFLVDELGLPDDYDSSKVEVLVNEICDTSRWTENYSLVFKFEGKYYQTYYSVGATELQDESPWEFDSEVDCVEVEPVKVTVIQYLAKQ
jgi:hypothetical protein